MVAAELRSTNARQDVVVLYDQPSEIIPDKNLCKSAWRYSSSAPIKFSNRIDFAQWSPQIFAASAQGKT